MYVVFLKRSVFPSYFTMSIGRLFSSFFTFFANHLRLFFFFWSSFVFIHAGMAFAGVLNFFPLCPFLLPLQLYLQHQNFPNAGVSSSSKNCRRTQLCFPFAISFCHCRINCSIKLSHTFCIGLCQCCGNFPCFCHLQKGPCRMILMATELVITIMCFEYIYIYIYIYILSLAT